MRWRLSSSPHDGDPVSSALHECRPILGSGGQPVTMPSDPLALLRSRSYVALLVLAAIIGVPISAAAYFFLALVSKLQGCISTYLPNDVAFEAEPLGWPVPRLVLAGVL